MPYKRLLFCVFISFYQLIGLKDSNSVYAQLNNQTLLAPVPVKAVNTNEIRFNLHLLGFNKNNEYFNDIADGYTLFGYHLLPKLSYNYGSSFRLEAGALIRKDFGNSGYQSVQPVLTAKFQKNNWALVFGNLEGNLNHGYIEPLYDFERIMTNRLENGMQFLYNSGRIKLDAWLDWNKMIYDRDPDQEIINGGASTAFQVLKRVGRAGAGDTTRLTLPVQFTAQHLGGQIDISDLPLVTVVNLAIGLELEREFPYKVLERIYTKNYLLGFKDYSNEYRQAFREGYGIYLNAGIDTKYQNVMVSYWEGNGYITDLGGRLFQSASTTVNNPDYIEKERRLLIVRFMNDIHLMKDLALTLRLEPLIDLNEPKLEFSNSFYLVFNTDFFLAKPRRN